MRRSTLGFVLLVATLVFAVAAPARTTVNWTGTWDTSWGPLTLTSSGGTLSGAFGYSDSWNEPLGHLQGSANGNVLSGTWSHDAPSHFAPRDHGSVTLTFSVVDGKPKFTGTATYAVDGQTVTWSGTCKSGACAVDGQPPTATALPASGKAGGKVALRYRVGDNSGKTAETVTVYRGSTVLWRTSTGLRAVTAGATYQAMFTAPKAGPLRFSVEARDAAGNKSAKSFATITLR